MKEVVIGKIAVPEGEGTTVMAGGREIAVFHAHGQFFAFDNTCPGDEASLGKGFLDGRRENVSCPWYGHSYSIKTGKSLFGDGEVRTYKIRLDGDSVVVMLEDK